MRDLAFGIIICLSFVCLVIVFCVVLIKLYIRKIKTYTQQLYQKDLDFQKALTTTIIETQEQVLNNISQDLHDDAGQQLTSINFQIENLKLDSPELKKALSPVSDSLGQLSQSIRSISHSLNDQMILQQDVIKAIETEIKRLKKNRKISLTYSFDGPKKEFGVNEKIFIYRIFQECINNCLKHAKATEVTVKIVTKPWFEMTISDNGKGFDSSNPKNNQSIGLSNMKTRAAGIDYNLAINSKNGEGTIIKLSENKN